MNSSSTAATALEVLHQAGMKVPKDRVSPPEISDRTMHFVRSEAAACGLSVDQLITRALLAYVVETDRIQRGGVPK